MPWNLFEWTWTRSKSRTQQTAADDPMLTYFLTEIDVRTRDIERTIGNDAEKRAVLSEIKDALTKFEATFNEPLGEPNYKAWNEAYRLERLIAVIEPGDNLLPELRRRVAQALQEKVTSATRLSAALEAALPQTFDTNETPPKLRPHGEAILRAMLLEIWKTSTGVISENSFHDPFCEALLVRLFFSALSRSYSSFAHTWSCTACWQCDRRPRSMSGLPLWSAVTAGLFGALFSRLLYLQMNWASLSVGGLKDARDLTSILLRCCVGMTGAVIVSFFLQANIVSGALFPHFDQIGLVEIFFPVREKSPDQNLGSLLPLHLVYPSQGLALLVMWCFLAGFSERLVPSILQETASSLGESVASKK